MNRENTSILQKTLTAPEILEAFGPEFLDPDFCRWWVLNRLNPNGAVCPACGAALQGRPVDRFFQGKQITCPACGRKFTAKTGTVFNGIKADFREALFFCFALESGRPMSWVAARLPGVELRTLYSYKEIFNVNQNPKKRGKKND